MIISLADLFWMFTKLTGYIIEGVGVTKCQPSFYNLSAILVEGLIKSTK